MDKIIVDVSYDDYFTTDLDKKIEKFLNKSFKKSGFEGKRRLLRFEYSSPIACKDAKKLPKKYPEAKVRVAIY